MKINQINISGQTIIAEKIDKISYNDTIGLNKEDFDRLKEELLKIKSSEFKEVMLMLHNIKEDKSRSTTGKERLKKFLVENGVAMANNISSSIIFEVLKILI